MKRTFNKIFYLIKNNLVSILIFIFFILNLLPSLISFPNSFLFLYKILLISLFLIPPLFYVLFIKKRVNIIFFLIFLIYVLTNLTVLILFKCEISVVFRGLLTSLYIIAIYYLIILYPRDWVRKDAFEIILFLFILFSLSSVIYSLCTENQVIIKAFTAEGEDAHFYQIKSFFENKNEFGLCLLVSAFGALFFIKKFQNNRVLLLVFSFLLILFGFYLFASRCKIALFIFVVAFGFLDIFLLCHLLKKSKSSFCVLVSLNVLLLLSFILIAGGFLNNISYFFAHLYNYFKETIFGQFIRSFDDRIATLRLCEPLFNNWKIITGYGEVNYLEAFFNYTYHKYLDNAFLSALLSGGLIKLILLLIAFIKTTTNAHYIKQYNRKKSCIFLLLNIFAFLYALSENISFVSGGWASLILSFFIASWSQVTLFDYRKRARNKNRILHVVGGFQFGGIETFIMTYLSEIQKHHDLTFDVYCFDTFDKKREEQLKSYNGRLFQGLAPKTINLVRAYLSFKKFLYNHDNYSVIHCSANLDNLIYLMASNELDISKRIHHGHAIAVSNSLFKSFTFMIRRLMCNLNANKFLCCDDRVAQSIFGKTIYFQKKYLVIYNAFDFSRISKSKESDIDKVLINIPKKSTVFGMYALFCDDKNQIFAVKLFEKMAKNDKDSYLILAGDGGEYKNNVISYIKAHKLNNQIIVLPRLTEIYSYLCRTDILLMPSKYEGFGIIAVEAQAAGCYVLASDQVPLTTDLRVKRIKYLPLDVDIWNEVIVNNNFKNLPISFEKIKQFDISNCYSVLYKIYMEK